MLVHRMTERQIKEVLRFVISKRESGLNSGISFSMNYDVFYLLGTFHTQKGAIEGAIGNRKNRESKFLLDLWNLIKPQSYHESQDMDLSSQFVDEYWIQ